MKNIIIVGITDFTDGLAGNGRVIEPSLGRDFAADHDQVALGVGLTGHAAAQVLPQAGVKNRVGNSVANFVRMAFADGLRGEDVIFTHGIGLLR